MEKTILFFIIVVFFYGCSKDKMNNQNNAVPKVSVKTSWVNPAKWSKTSLQYKGEVVSDDGSQIIERGVCWSSSDSVPTISNSVKRNGQGVGFYEDSITNLIPGTKYYVRAFAKNNTGAFYGEVIIVFTNLHRTGLKVISNSVANDAKWTGDALVYFGLDYASYTPFHNLINTTNAGFCYSTSHPNPTLSDSIIRYPYYITVGSNSGGSFSSWLKPFIKPTIHKTYHIRAYAYNIVDTVYADNEVTVSTGDFEQGLYYGGGIIFSVDGTGQHGLIVAIEDQGKQVPWVASIFSTTLINSNSADGSINTSKIINTVGNSGYYAAKLCRDYRGGGNTDWYLPSGSELNILKLNQMSNPGSIPGLEYDYQLVNFYYWSSSEYNYFNTWASDFNLRYYNVGYGEKKQLLYVRAIRKF